MSDTAPSTDSTARTPYSTPGDPVIVGAVDTAATTAYIGSGIDAQNYSSAT